MMVSGAWLTGGSFELLSCCLSQKWLSSPHYIILVDTRDRLTPQLAYVPQENIDVVQQSKVRYFACMKYLNVYIFSSSRLRYTACMKYLNACFLLVKGALLCLHEILKCLCFLLVKGALLCKKYFNG